MGKRKNKYYEIIEMLRVERTVYCQVCRRIKAKTPFAPVFYDISESEVSLSITVITLNKGTQGSEPLIFCKFSLPVLAFGVK